MLLAHTRLVCVVLTLLAATAVSAAAQEPPPDAQAPRSPGPPDGPPSWSWGVTVARHHAAAAACTPASSGSTSRSPSSNSRIAGYRGLDVTPPPLTGGVETDHELKVGVGVNLFGFGGYKASDYRTAPGRRRRTESEL